MQTQSQYAELSRQCFNRRAAGKGAGKISEYLIRNQKKHSLVILQRGDTDLDDEFRFHLIDYRNENEVLKKGVFSYKNVFEKNKVLEGSGMAWARVD